MWWWGYNFSISARYQGFIIENNTTFLQTFWIVTIVNKEMIIILEFNQIQLFVACRFKWKHAGDQCSS